MLGLGVNGTVTVDWGDGTSANTLAGTDLDVAQWTSTHSYATPGDYVIRLTVNGEAQLYGNRYPYILSHSSSNDNRNNVYQSSLLKAEIGTGIHIGDYAFYFCRSLSSITIPNTITSIGKYAFTSCFSLLGITIPNNIINIIENTFETCYSLSNITMPNTITNIGNYAFMMCSCLSNITIPNSVASIGDYAFVKCYSMKYYDFTSHTSILSLSSAGVFNGIPADCEIRVPASLAEEWKAATNWATYADYIVGV